MGKDFLAGFRKEYDKRIKNYICGNGIKPEIEWYNPEVFGEKLYFKSKSEICATDETSALLPEELETEDLSATSLPEDKAEIDDDDATSPENTGLDDVDESDTSDNEEDDDATSAKNTG